MGDYDFEDDDYAETLPEDGVGQATPAYLLWLQQHRVRIVAGACVAAVILIVAVVVIVAAIAWGPSGSDDDGTSDMPESNMLWASLSMEGVWTHLEALSAVAEANDGTRVVTGPGFNASVDYVYDTLVDKTDFDVSKQYFSADSTVINSTPIMEEIIPDQEPIPFVWVTDFKLMSFSGSGDVVAPLAEVEAMGCELEDFPEDTAGKIALVARGNCTFYEKATNALESGAVGLIVSNYEFTPGPTAGTLGEYVELPCFGVDYDLGAALGASGNEIHLVANTTLLTYYGTNVCAETKTGRADRTIVIGAHLDSVEAGPGINDNGSGSSSVLEIALEFADNVDNENRVRFCWWGAEEEGLVGSTYYVESLTEAQKANISANLNFDMLGSPNFIYGILNGTSADDAINPGCTKIQEIFQDFFTLRNLPFTIIPFTGRSDYGPFLEAGIPAGGAETGAEVVKSMAERTMFGGMAQTSYDPCYHSACDTLENVSNEALTNMAQAAAYTLEVLAVKEELNDFLGQSDNVGGDSARALDTETSLMYRRQAGH